MKRETAAVTKRNVRSQRGEEGNQKELLQQAWAGRGAFLGDDALLQKSPEFQGWLRDTPRLLRSEQHQLLGDDTATTGRDRVGLLVYERGEGGCTVSDTVRVRDLWLFPVALSVGKPRLLSRCLAVQVWMDVWQSSWSPPGYSKPVPVQSSSSQQPVTAGSRPGPATGSHATPHQDLGGGTGEGEGGPRLHGVAPKTSQDHSWGRGLAGLTLP